MTKAEEDSRLEAIVDGASRLPVENQEYILAAIRGMLFTRRLLLRQSRESTEQAAAPATLSRL